MVMCGGFLFFFSGQHIVTLSSEHSLGETGHQHRFIHK